MDQTRIAGKEFKWAPINQQEQKKYPHRDRVERQNVMRVSHTRGRNQTKNPQK